jgi:hypothetical protein
VAAQLTPRTTAPRSKPPTITAAHRRRVSALRAARRRHNRGHPTLPAFGHQRTIAVGHTADPPESGELVLFVGCEESRQWHDRLLLRAGKTSYPGETIDPCNTGSSQSSPRRMWLPCATGRGGATTRRSARSSGASMRDIALGVKHSATPDGSVSCRRPGMQSRRVLPCTGGPVRPLPR